MLLASQLAGARNPAALPIGQLNQNVAMARAGHRTEAKQTLAPQFVKLSTQRHRFWIIPLDPGAKQVHDRSPIRFRIGGERIAPLGRSTDDNSVWRLAPTLRPLLLEATGHRLTARRNKLGGALAAAGTTVILGITLFWQQSGEPALATGSRFRCPPIPLETSTCRLAAKTPHPGHRREAVVGGYASSSPARL